MICTARAILRTNARFGRIVRLLIHRAEIVVAASNGYRYRWPWMTWRASSLELSGHCAALDGFRTPALGDQVRPWLSQGAGNLLLQVGIGDVRRCESLKIGGCFANLTYRPRPDDRN